MDEADRFPEIRGLCEKFLLSAHRVRRTIGGAINWADLSCVEVSWIVSDLGENRYHVDIEEADPSATELQNYIEKKFKEHGLKVEVFTEW